MKLANGILHTLHLFLVLGLPRLEQYKGLFSGLGLFIDGLLQLLEQLNVNFGFFSIIHFHGFLLLLLEFLLGILGRHVGFFVINLQVLFLLYQISVVLFNRHDLIS